MTGLPKIKPSASAMCAPLFEDALLNNYTNIELIDFIKASPRLTTTREEIIWVLSLTLAAKSVPWTSDALSEVNAMKEAHSTGANAPIVYRVVDDTPGNKQWIIMDRVFSEAVEQIWPCIGLWTSLRIAFQLCSAYPTTGGLHSGQVKSEWIQALYGPVQHASPPPVVDEYPTMEGWTACKTSTQKEHVLVHRDLAPCNLIMDKQWKLWVIDWGHADFYPPVLEFLGVEARSLAIPWICENTWMGWSGRLRWPILQ